MTYSEGHSRSSELALLEKPYMVQHHVSVMQLVRDITVIYSYMNDCGHEKSFSWISTVKVIDYVRLTIRL